MNRTGQRKSNRRGIAMLLVVVSLMAATILTTAYVASRDNSPAIGQNVSDSTSARWAADSALALSVATMETEKDWRAEAALHGGKMVDGVMIGSASVSIAVKDLATGLPPNPTTENIQITATATVNGVKQSTVANAFVPLEPGLVADLDLSEFAVFANDGLAMSERSLLTRWPMAPLSTLGRRVSVGTRATSASSIVLSNSAAALDTTVFHGPGASGSLISNAASPAIEKVGLLDPIPLPVPPGSAETTSLLPLLDLVMNGGVLTVLTDSHSRNLTLRNNAVRTLQGNIKAVYDQNCTIDTGAKLVIDGDVKVVVFGNLSIDQGSIELKPNARLRLYVRGTTGSPAVFLRDSYIGDLRADNLRDNTGKAAWMDPQRVTLFSIAPTGSACEWRIRGNSVVKGSVYSPQSSRIRIEESSAVYGRIAAKMVELRDDATVFYDPSLDSRC